MSDSTFRPELDAIVDELESHARFLLAIDAHDPLAPAERRLVDNVLAAVDAWRRDTSPDAVARP